MFWDDDDAGWWCQCMKCGNQLRFETEDEAEESADEQADNGCEECGAKYAFEVFEAD